MKDIKIINKVENNEMRYSTEGLKKYINKEFKINISLDPSTAEYILNKMIEKVSNKENIENKSFDDEILNCRIYFVYKENDIVIVFPDKKMKYPWDKDCSKLFANQI